MNRERAREGEKKSGKAASWTEIISLYLLPESNGKQQNFYNSREKKAIQLFARIILQRQNVCEFLHIEMK